MAIAVPFVVTTNERLRRCSCLAGLALSLSGLCCSSLPVQQLPLLENSSVILSPGLVLPDQRFPIWAPFLMVSAAVLHQAVPLRGIRLGTL